jgi:O-succinylbenzoic acid--CoA ligase
MQYSAKMTCDFFNFKEGDSACLCLPVAYISGKMMLVRAIERKMLVNILKPSSKPLIELNTNIDFCAMTPLQVENSLEKIHFIKNLIIGGAQVSENLKSKLSQTLSKTNYTGQIFETYGMSETLSHIALKEIYPNVAEYFTVLDGVDIAQDERGCLIINASNLTSETLQTNDIVELKGGKHFKFLGRTDFIINSGGVKIFPEILENFLKKEIAKVGFYCELIYTGIEDEILGQRLVLAIEGEKSENLKQQLSQITYPSKNHQPKEIFYLERFPRIPNGKVNRKELLNLILQSK